MANPNQPTLHPGATGPAVRRLQRALRRTPNLGLVVDRVFGPRTETAVRDFQDQPDLVVDGIVGPATWAARRRGCAAPAPGQHGRRRLVFHLFGALAQFSVIWTRRDVCLPRWGLAAARARGRSGGRRSKLGADQRRTARTLYDERQLTVAQIGQVLGVSRTSIYRALGQDTAAASGAAVPRMESTA